MTPRLGQRYPVSRSRLLHMPDRPHCCTALGTVTAGVLACSGIASFRRRVPDRAGGASLAGCPAHYQTQDLCRLFVGCVAARGAFSTPAGQPWLTRRRVIDSLLRWGSLAGDHHRRCSATGGLEDLRAPTAFSQMVSCVPSPAALGSSCCFLTFCPCRRAARDSVDFLLHGPGSVASPSRPPETGVDEGLSAQLLISSRLLTPARRRERLPRPHLRALGEAPKATM